jgi:hypothetical protein
MQAMATTATKRSFMILESPQFRNMVRIVIIYSPPSKRVEATLSQLVEIVLKNIGLITTGTTKNNQDNPVIDMDAE